MLRSTILSHFDSLQGPSILATVPALERDSRPFFEAVPKLIDVADEEHFFVATLQGVYTANYFFKVKDTSSRGRHRLLLLSLAFEPAGLDDKDRALRFLNASEPLLVAAARDIKDHAPLLAHAIADPAGDSVLMNRLHALHGEGFHGLLGSMIEPLDGARGKIAVIGLPGLDARGVVDSFMTELKRAGPADLRSKLILGAASELVFMDFSCVARGAPFCWADRCPDCKGLAVQSDAVLVVLDRGILDADVAAGISPYLAAMLGTKPLPVIVMETADRSSRGQSGKVDPVAVPGLDPAFPRFVVPRGDVAAFKDLMAELIKRII